MPGFPLDKGQHDWKQEKEEAPENYHAIDGIQSFINNHLRGAVHCNFNVRTITDGLIPIVFETIKKFKNMNRISYLFAHHIVIIALVTACSSPQGNKSTVPDEKEVETLVDDLYGGTGGISVDAEGNIYSSDFGPFLGQINENFKVVSKVFKITPEGEVTVFIDSILGASGSEFDNQGNFYQANIRGGFVSKVAASGEVTEYVRDSIVGPVGLQMDTNGDLIVCNCSNNTLRRVKPSGESILFSRGEIFKCPNGITIDDNGNFYTANFYNGDVIKIEPDGTPTVFATIPGNNNGHIAYRSDYLYVVGRAANQIYKVSMSGDIELFAGNGERGRRNGSRLEASFSLPNDLGFSPDGKFLYVNEASDSLGSPRILIPTAVRRIRMPD